MSFAVAIPRGMIERKPAHGSPCTNCGACCSAVLCRLALHLFGAQPGPCPALVIDDEGHSSCGVVKEVGDPELAKAALLIIGAGDGCDARFNGEPINHAFNAKLAQLDRKRAKHLRAARKLWGLKHV